MKKKTIIISGIATVLVIGSVVFCFAVKGDSTQPAEVAQTVTEAVATPTIEIPEETSEEVSEPEEVEEVEVAEVPEEEPEVEETTEKEETSSEVSIVEVAETTEEDAEEKGVSTPEAEEVAEPTQPVAETKAEQTQPTETQPNVNQISADEASQALINQILADGGVMGGNPTNSTEGGFVSSGGAAAQIIVE